MSKNQLPGIKRITDAQRRERRELAARYYIEGYSVHAICRALHIGTHQLRRELEAAGVHMRFRGYGLKTPCPEWLPDAAAADRRPAYLDSRVVSDVATFVADFNGGDYPNVLANQLARATAEQDDAWLRWVEDTIVAAHDQTAVLLRVVRDAAFRDRCRRGKELDIRTRDRDTPRLRVVRGRGA